MASRNSHRRRLRNHFREHSLGYQLGLILGGTVAAGALFILLVRVFQSGRESSFENEAEISSEEAEELSINPEEQRFPQPVGLETFSLRKVIGYALEAQGGRENLEKVTSLRRTGHIRLFNKDSAEPSEMESSILFRRPDRMRYAYQIEGLSFVAAYDGNTAWRQVTRGQTELPADELSKKEELLMRVDLETMRPLSETLRDPDRLELAPELSDPANPSWPIVRDLGWMRETLHFDRTTFLCRRRLVTTETPEDGPMEIDVVYEDFRYVDRIAMPYSIRVWIDGELNNELTISATEVNLGVLPMVFEKPSN